MRPRRPKQYCLQYICIYVTGKFEIQVEMISIQLNLILTWVEIESTKHEQKFNHLFASTCILVSKSVLEGREYG